MFCARIAGLRNKCRDLQSKCPFIHCGLRFARRVYLNLQAPNDEEGNSPVARALGYPFYSTLVYSCLGAFLKCSRPRAPFLTQMLTLLDGHVKSAQPCFEFESVS